MEDSLWGRPSFFVACRVRARRGPRYFDVVLEDFFAGAFVLSEVVSHAGLLHVVLPASKVASGTHPPLAQLPDGQTSKA